MKTKNAIMYWVNSYRSIFKKCLTLHNIGYLVLVAVLVTSGVSGACSYIGGIQQEDSMKITAGVRPNSSLAKGSQDDWFIPSIKDGTNLVIYLGKMGQGHPGTSATGPSQITIWLETSQEGLEISENEITITEWSRACIIIYNQNTYFSSNGSGVLKIRKKSKKQFFGGQKTSFHGTARFNFTDPSVNTVWPGSNSEKNIDWTFSLNEREGALLFSIKESKK